MRKKKKQKLFKKEDVIMNENTNTENYKSAQGMIWFDICKYFGYPVGIIMGLINIITILSYGLTSLTIAIAVCQTFMTITLVIMTIGLYTYKKSTKIFFTINLACTIVIATINLIAEGMETNFSGGQPLEFVFLLLFSIINYGYFRARFHLFVNPAETTTATTDTESVNSTQTQNLETTDESKSPQKYKNILLPTIIIFLIISLITNGYQYMAYQGREINITELEQTVTEQKDTISQLNSKIQEDAIALKTISTNYENIIAELNDENLSISWFNEVVEAENQGINYSDYIYVLSKAADIELKTWYNSNNEKIGAGYSWDELHDIIASLPLTWQEKDKIVELYLENYEFDQTNTFYYSTKLISFVTP